MLFHEYAIVFNILQGFSDSGKIFKCSDTTCGLNVTGMPLEKLVTLLAGVLGNLFHCN